MYRHFFKIRIKIVRFFFSVPRILKNEGPIIAQVANALYDPKRKVDGFSAESANMHQYPSIRLTLIVGSFFALAYTAVIVAFLCVVVKQFDILNGYPRPDLKPGPFVSDRYQWGEIFLILSMTRAIFPFLYLFTLIGLKDFYKRIWFERFCAYVLLLDLVLFFFFVITICFFCNSTYFPSSPCNDPRWCEAFGPDHPDRCPPIPPILQPCDLSPNPVFLNWIYFTLAFFFMDVIIYFLNLDMSGYVAAFMLWYRWAY